MAASVQGSVHSTISYEIKLISKILSQYPVDTGRKLNVHKTFRRCPGRSMSTASCVYWVHKDGF